MVNGSQLYNNGQCGGLDYAELKQTQNGAGWCPQFGTGSVNAPTLVALPQANGQPGMQVRRSVIWFLLTKTTLVHVLSNGAQSYSRQAGNVALQQSPRSGQFLMPSTVGSPANFLAPPSSGFRLPVM